MPYIGRDLSMIIPLPTQGVGLSQLENTLVKDGLSPWFSQMRKQTVEVYLPHFKLENGFSWNAKLEALGTVDDFDEDLTDY